MEKKLMVGSLVVALVCAAGALLLATAAVVYVVSAEPEPVVVERPQDQPVLSEPAAQPRYYPDPLPGTGTDRHYYEPIPVPETPLVCQGDDGYPTTRCD